MANTFGQNQKILMLERILEERTDENHKLSADKLINIMKSEYGIDAERKSIYRYMGALAETGICVERDSDGYYISDRTFELAELKLLVDAVQSSRFITRRKSAELIEKLGTLVSRYMASSLNRQVYVSGRIKSMNESIYYSVDGLHTALLERRRISFRYFDWNEKKEKVYRHDGAAYIAEPLFLCWNDENYYLIARDIRVDIIKHFRVDKMEKIELTDEHSAGTGLSDAEMAGYADRHFGMFGGDEVLVVLRCRNELAGVMIDRFGKDTVFRPSGEDYFTISVKVAESVHFFTWILNFSGGVSIYSPENVKRRFREFVCDAYERTMED